MTQPKLCGVALDGDVMRRVALGMADGQIEQADLWLCVVDRRARRPGSIAGEPLLRALEHMRSACKWMQAIP